MGDIVIFTARRASFSIAQLVQRSLYYQPKQGTKAKSLKTTIHTHIFSSQALSGPHAMQTRPLRADGLMDAYGLFMSWTAELAPISVEYCLVPGTPRPTIIKHRKRLAINWMIFTKSLLMGNGCFTHQTSIHFKLLGPFGVPG